jgi:hypothetical protein
VDYKLRIFEEYDAAPAGEKGAIFRREGLYDSSVQLWRSVGRAARYTYTGVGLRSRLAVEAHRLAVNFDD